MAGVPIPTRPSRSKEQIAYGKGASPRTVKEDHGPYHVKKQGVL